MSRGHFPESFYQSAEYEDGLSQARTRRVRVTYSPDQPCESCGHEECLHAPNCIAEECECSAFDESLALKVWEGHRCN